MLGNSIATTPVVLLLQQRGGTPGFAGSAYDLCGQIYVGRGDLLPVEPDTT